MKSLNEQVAEEVRALLARRRMSAAGLARKLDVSQTYVWRRLEGQTAFDLDDLAKIAAVLEVGVFELLPSAVRDAGPQAIAQYFAPSGRTTEQPWRPADNRPTSRPADNRPPKVGRTAYLTRPRAA